MMEEDQDQNSGDLDENTANLGCVIILGTVMAIIIFVASL